MKVETTCGWIEGVREGRFEVFKNIPFAAPPIGPLRFKPPQLPQKWDGVRDCTAYGPRAVQDRSKPENAGAWMSEADCLNLNVWTPGVDQQKRPVLVHIHGGGLCWGANSDAGSEGQRFAQDREIVVVSIQYRLGVLGYLHLRHLLGEEYAQSGNCGLLDQVAALRWVQENIERFGGDPENVTIMGQSAGGRSVGGLLVTPEAKGLFHKAILQSGAIQSVHDEKTARELTRQILEAFGLQEEDAAQLLEMPAEALIVRQNRLDDGRILVHYFGPVIDGITITQRPEDVIAGGVLGNMPLLVGSNRDEMCPPPSEEAFTPAYVALKLNSFGANRPHVEAQYQKLKETQGGPLAMANTLTQYVYGNQALALAALAAKAGGPVWLYRWDHDQNRVPAAAHATEMAYIFGGGVEQPDKGYPDTEENHKLAKLMNDIWTGFVQRGEPSAPGLPDWPPYRKEGMGTRMHLCPQPYTEEFDLARGYDKEMPYQVMRYE